MDGFDGDIEGKGGQEDRENLKNYLQSLYD